MQFSVKDAEKENLLETLKIANLGFQRQYPGDRPDRQPVHTLYGGADLFSSDTCVKMGEIALRSLQNYAPNFVALARAVQPEGYGYLPATEKEIVELTQKLEQMKEEERRKEKAWLPWLVYNKVIKKLQEEPVEDFRIDFEDGFGNRPDEEEDAATIRAARELAQGMKNKTVSPFIGIRIKPFTEDLKYRGARTLDLFITSLVQKTGGLLPANFVVMLPKVTIPEQVRTLVRLFEILERENGLSEG